MNRDRGCCHVLTLESLVCRWVPAGVGRLTVRDGSSAHILCRAPASMLHSQHHVFAAGMCLRAEFPSWCNGPGHLQLRRTRRESLLPHICELTMLPSLHTPFRRADANLISEHSEWQMRHLRCVRPACRVVSAWPAPLGACLCLLLLVCRPGAGSESTCVRGRRCRSWCGPLWPLLAMPPHAVGDSDRASEGLERSSTCL